MPTAHSPQPTAESTQAAELHVAVHKQHSNRRRILRRVVW